VPRQLAGFSSILKDPKEEIEQNFSLLEEAGGELSHLRLGMRRAGDHFSLLQSVIQ
jgi:hypothetical protein